MKSYNLSFGVMRVLGKNRAEVIVNEGVDMGVLQVKEYLNFLSTHLEPPFSVIVNRKYSYTYTFEAQKLIVNNDKIKNLAVIVSSSGGLLASETLLSLNEKSKWNTKFFRTRADAILWLDKNS